MHNFQDRTVREIALDSPATIRVFETHKIDFCCGGRIPLDEACAKVGADPAKVVADLEKVFAGGTDDGDAAERKSLSELIEHIVTTHHEFTRSEIARLGPLADKVVTRHGEHHPELLRIRDIAKELGQELLVHMQKEEMMLFPYIGRLARAAEANSVPTLPPFGTVNNPVRMMMFEHDQAGEMLREMRELSNDYTVPEGACPSYMGLFSGLEELEKDLHRHIHLENNVLFPKAVEIESAIFAMPSAAVAG